MDTEKALKDIVAQMQKSLECSICLELLNCPVSTKCDHQFCSFCLFKFLENKRSVPCPLCKKPIIKRGLQERSDLTGVIENVKRLITAFETDVGEKSLELTSPRNLKEFSKDGNTDKNCENTSGEKNNPPLRQKKVDCPDQERSSRSRTKCRVSNRPSMLTLHPADDKATISKIAEKRSKKEKKSLVNNDGQNVGNLLQYLENGPCGEEKERTGLNNTKTASEKLKVLNKNDIGSHENKSEKCVEIGSEEQKQKIKVVSEKENPGCSSKEHNLLAETVELYTIGPDNLTEVANGFKSEASTFKKRTLSNKTRATRSSTRSRVKQQELRAEEPEEEHKITKPQQDHRATKPIQEHSATKPNQEHVATKPIQEHIAKKPIQEHSATKTNQEHSATKPIQEHSATKPNQEHKTTEPDKVSINEEEAGQHSASSSVSSVSSTQQLLKPKPVVSRTYSKGMQNKFLAEGCVRNWVETLPKPDVTKEIKSLTTKEKIDVKKRVNINILNSKMFGTNVVSKTGDNFKTKLQECISGKDLLERPITPRLRRSLFKNRTEDKVQIENIVGQDPFEFTSSQTPVKIEVQLSKKRKRSKDEKRSKIAEKRAPLNFFPSSDLTYVASKQTACQIETKEADSAQETSIIDAADTLATVKVGGHQPECLDNCVEQNRETMLDCLVDTVQNTNVQSELVIKDTNANPSIINSSNINSPSKDLRGDHKNNGRPLSKSRVAKKKGPLLKKRNNIEIEDFPISQNSHCEMTKLIDKISQAEDHEFLFCTQEVHKKMEESVSDDQTVLANKSPASKDIILQTQSTGIIADSLAVPVKVQVSDIDIVNDTYATQPNVVLNADVLSHKIQSICSSDIVINTEISSGSVLEYDSQKLGIVKGMNSYSALKETIDFENEPNKMQNAIHQTQIQEKSCAFDDKYFLDPKTLKADHLSMTQRLLDNSKTPKGKSILINSNTPQSEYLFKNSKTPEVETLLKNLNTPQDKQFPNAPKTPQNNSLSGNLWTPQCKKLSDTPKTPLTTPNRSFTSKYCLPDLNEMIQVSPGPKGFIPVNSFTTSRTNGSEKSVVPDTNQGNVSVSLDLFVNRSREAPDKTIDALTHMDEHNGSYDTARSVHLNKREQFLVSKISDIPEEIIHVDNTILVPDTVMDAGPTEMVFQSQDNIIIHETLDVEQMLTCRSTSTESDQVEPVHNAVTNKKSNDSNIIMSTNKSCLQSVMETQHASLESTVSREMLSTTPAENVQLQDYMTKDFTRLPNVSNGIGNSQPDNSEETPSTMSQSILKVNLDQVIKGTETIKVPSPERETKCNDNNIYIMDGSGDCIMETDTDFPPSKQMLLPNNCYNSGKKHKLDDGSLCQTVPKKAHLARKLICTGDSVNSAPGRLDLPDSEDEDTFLLMRRSKRRCLSLNDTPMKPIVFNSRQEETVYEVDELVGETEAIDAPVNCTEREKIIGPSTETVGGLIISNKELDSPTTNPCATQLKTSVDITESVNTSSAEKYNSSDASVSNKCQLTPSVHKSLSTDSCQQETEIIPESSITNSYKLSMDMVSTKKTKRGLASKRMIYKPNSSRKLPIKSPNKNTPVVVENINDLELAEQESKDKQEERSEEDLLPDDKVEKGSKKTGDISSMLSKFVKDKSLSQDKNLIPKDSNITSPEKWAKKQLELKLFGDEVEKSERMGERLLSKQVDDISQHKDTMAVTASEEDVEMSFDLGLDCNDQETVPEQTQCLSNERGNEPIPETAQHTNQEDEDLENGNSLSGSLPLTSSPLHANTNSENQDNLNQSAISVDDFDDVNNTDEEKDDDDDDCERINKKGKKLIIASDSDESDQEDHTTATSSSFMSSQSETLTTQQQLALEGDLEKLHQEIAKCEAELRKQQYSACLSPGHQPKTPQVNDIGSNYVKGNNKDCVSENSSNCMSAIPTSSTLSITPVVIEDSPECVSEDDKNDEDSNDLFLSPDLAPALSKDLTGNSSGSKPTRLSQVKDHFLKQFQSPGGSFRSKKCLEFVKADVIRESGLSNKGPMKTLSVIKKNIITTESHKSNSDKIGEKATSPVLSSQRKHFSLETKGLEGSKLKNELCKKNLVLTASGLNRDDHLLLLTFCEKFGAVLHPKFTKEVSHVIMKPAAGFELVCDRTLKFFQGLAHKCWVLSFAWIAKSLDAGDVLFEADFEIEGDTSCGETLYGAKHARLSNKHLFTNFSFACIGNSEEMSKENLCEILQASGAVIVDDPIALVSQLTKYKLIIRCSDGDNMPTPVELDMFNGLYKHMRLLTIMREWVLDSLGSYRLIPLLDYVLNATDQVQVPF